MTKLKQKLETQGSHCYDNEENLDSDSPPCTENSSSQTSRLSLGLQRLRSSQEAALDSSSEARWLPDIPRKQRDAEETPCTPEAGKSRNAELTLTGLVGNRCWD